MAILERMRASVFVTCVNRAYYARGRALHTAQPHASRLETRHLLLPQTI